MADWLQECGIKKVAMESTGVYWIAAFQVLERRGFEVRLVNARQVKNVSGRKSDVLDCQWLQRLHSYGLLNASFRPADAMCVLRTYLRYRDELVSARSVQCQHMQKALQQMNVQLHQVLSDITGVSGLRIIEAILAGEREGRNWRAWPIAGCAPARPRSKRRCEGIIAPSICLCCGAPLSCIRPTKPRLRGAMSRSLRKWPRCPPARRRTKSRCRRASRAGPLRCDLVAGTDLRKELYRCAGVDLTAIEGIGVLTAQVVISEIGLDMGRWPTEKHFSSWLGLCPDHRISGGKVLSRHTRHVLNPVADALRMAATTLQNSKTALGAFYRRMRGRLGAASAITATAHKLARIIYRLLKHGEHYVQQGLEAYEKKYRERLLQNLKKTAAALGLELTQKQQLPPCVS